MLASAAALRRTALAGALLAPLAAGCAADGPPDCTPEAQAPDLNITVIDAKGGAVCGALVSLLGASQGQRLQITGRDDRCNLYSAHIVPDTYAVTVSADGFTTDKSSLVVAYADQRCGTAATTSRTVTLQRP